MRYVLLIFTNVCASKHIKHFYDVFLRAHLSDWINPGYVHVAASLLHDTKLLKNHVNQQTYMCPTFKTQMHNKGWGSQ